MGDRRQAAAEDAPRARAGNGAFCFCASRADAPVAELRQNLGLVLGNVVYRRHAVANLAPQELVEDLHHVLLALERLGVGMGGRLWVPDVPTGLVCQGTARAGRTSKSMCFMLTQSLKSRPVL